ncbi:MAG: hypothetical protein ACI8W0_002063, partial [Flavobacterium sp.]
MLEEKNDNLQEADGNLTTDSIESTQDDSIIAETPTITETPEPEIATAETNNAAVSTDERAPETAAVIENQNQKALSSIDDSNAEEGEDETLKERHQIPLQDYDTLSMEALVDEIDALVSTEKVMSIKEHVEEIKKAFLAKYNHFIEEKKEEYHAENPDTTEDLQYHYPLKSKFDQIYSHFRDNKNTHFKSLQTNLK